MSSVNDIASVLAYREWIDKLLSLAAKVKPEQAIEPPVPTAELSQTITAIYENWSLPVKDNTKQAHFATIEEAFRDKLYDLITTLSIDDPSFTQIWNLLDILSIFTENGQCEPGLIWWLIEELLDSQTIDGCRVIFDYLESRRERIVTLKHFRSQNLIILRSCNELLRRLSRAEDTVFCGRVFIFLFQSFPLGDRSAINLRGEYHVENVTTFDELPLKQKDEEISMDVDAATQNQAPIEPPKAHSSKADKDIVSIASGPADTAVIDVKTKEARSPPDFDTLYPMFWSLQENFALPIRLFNQDYFDSFKKGLEATINTFQKINAQFETRITIKSSDDVKNGSKRKRVEDGEEAGSWFNPKYLTSRDLFELEISDIAFRRHVLVQALIILDFLLSLTPESKSKFADLNNKSVLYSYILKEEDAGWAAQMKSTIASYLQLGDQGRFYYRMVETVLSRDRNWVRWKAEGCPAIELKPVSHEQLQEAQDGAKKAFANKRLRSMPLGSLDLRFLSQEESSKSLEKLRSPTRYATPAPDALLKAIDSDELNLQMAMTDDDKQLYTNAKSSKTWKTLRIASRSKLGLFDKVPDGNNLKILFEPPNDIKHDDHIENGDNAAKDDMAEENMIVEGAKQKDGETSSQVELHVEAADATAVK